MKFATIALISSAAAIKISAEEGKCHGSRKITDYVFKQIDTSGDGEIQATELEAALKWLADAMHHEVTAKEAKWIKASATKAAGKDKQMNPKEFNVWGNEFVNHFGLCAEAEAAVKYVESQSLAETEADKCKGSMKQTNAVFDQIDTDHSEEIDATELETALKALAKEMNYTPTKKDVAWIEKTAAKAAGKDEKMSRKEFHRWGNRFVNHFKLCDVAAEHVLAQTKKETCEGNMDTTNKVFDMIDSNHNGQITKNELVPALIYLAKEMHYDITPKDWAWVKETAYKAAGSDKQLDKKEFNKWGNEFVNHFDLCAEAKAALSE